jgi:Xaa-Pro aminopeptidase
MSIIVYGDTSTSPELRHEMPLSVPDPFLYVEHDGRQIVVVAGYEVPRLESFGLTALPLEQFGLDDLLSAGASRSCARLDSMARACRELGIESAHVPPTFPLELADRMREEQIVVRVDRELFEERRRRKTPSQLAGIARAQRAAEAGMAAAASLMRAAVERQGLLEVNGEPLTSELLKEAITRAYDEHRVLAEDMIVAHGAQIFGHDPGSGQIALAEPVVIDLAPRDPLTRCFADMTRTFVVGEPPAELLRYHELVHEALSIATAAVRPGIEGRVIYELVCELFHEHGYQTELTKSPGTVVTSGFFHGLGHGVGLEIHERPFLARSTDVLVAGDVITLEPGLYRDGFGGCRLEDLVLVGDTCGQPLTDFPYSLVP